jgi:hypothetical protein
MDNMNIIKEALIIAMIERRLKYIRQDGTADEWMADVMNFGWIGFDKHTDEELLETAEILGIENPPTLEQLQDQTNKPHN